MSAPKTNKTKHYSSGVRRLERGLRDVLTISHHESANVHTASEVFYVDFNQAVTIMFSGTFTFT